MFRDGRQIKFECLAKRNDEYFGNVVLSVAKVFDQVFFMNAVNHEHDSEKVVPVPFAITIEFDDRMEYVEEFRGFRDEPDFFGQFADDRVTMIFAMVDAPAGKIKFPNVGSSGFLRQHDAPVKKLYDGVSAGADGRENGGHYGRIQEIPTEITPLPKKCKSSYFVRNFVFTNPIPEGVRISDHSPTWSRMKIMSPP